jgi:hypothetical protein
MKQAVVLIHGIGEQRPMDTIRKFVDSILPKRRKSHFPKFHNKPDRMSESFELRLLRSLADRKQGRPTTDFYEFYWAHHMRDSRFSQVYSWMARLLLRSPGKVPPALKPIYWVLWAGSAIILALLVWAVFAGGEGSELLRLYKRKQAYFAAALAVIQAVGGWFLLRYVADAARYLTPSPDNIEQRNRIRSEGVSLLRNIHESKKYSRIVVVGHSLGSVIGYDILRFLWDEYRIPLMDMPAKQDESKSFDEDREKIFNTGNESVGTRIDKFQQKQHRLWRELRKPELNTPWLVTDLITLGSPMAHGMMLMAKDEEEFNARKREFEYPTCPPYPNPDGVYYERKTPMLNRRIPHHGAPFSCTRWTNLYFPYRRLIFGDLIGGPLRPIFGEGIKDIPVKMQYNRDRPGFLGHLGALLGTTLVSHVRYWKAVPKTPIGRLLERAIFQDVAKSSLWALKSSLMLDSLRAKEPWPEP